MYTVYGIWYMVYGIWYMVYGIWYMVSPRAGATPPSSRLLGGGVPARGCYRKREWLCVRFPTLGERHMLSHPCSERWRATQFTSLYGISLRWPHIFPPRGLRWCRSTWLRLRGQTRGRDGGLRGQAGGVSWLQLCGQTRGRDGGWRGHQTRGRDVQAHNRVIYGILWPGQADIRVLYGISSAGNPESIVNNDTFRVHGGPAKRKSVWFTVLEAPGSHNLS